MKLNRVLPIVTIAVLATALATPALAQAQGGERWLHVRVEKTGEDAELVRVNIPLRLAEKVLPAIHAGHMRGGRVRAHLGRHDVDLRAILEAVRDTADGEFITVEKNDETIRVAKESGYLIVRVDERGEKGERVDAKVPMAVIEALLSGEEDELDVLAAIRVLNEMGEEVMVRVEGKNETVRIWVDSQNTSE
ncbi:MAG: hypothetical protein ACE5HB_02885 [Terriglobia bacterium]